MKIHGPCKTCSKESPFATIETRGLDELWQLNVKLAGLLADAHPGLTTWQKCLSRTLMAMADFAGHGHVSAAPEVAASHERLLKACEQMASIGGTPQCVGAVFFECARDAARDAIKQAPAKAPAKATAGPETPPTSTDTPQTCTQGPLQARQAPSSVQSGIRPSGAM